MAVTTEKSTEYARVTAAPQGYNNPTDWHGRARIYTFNFTQGSSAGDASSLAYLVKLPPGKVRVILPESRIAFSALGTSRTIDIGWLAHTDPSGTTVNADPNGLDDGIDGSSAGSAVPTGTVGGAETYLFESRDGVTLTAQVNDGTIPAAATLKGYFTVVTD